MYQKVDFFLHKLLSLQDKYRCNFITLTKALFQCPSKPWQCDNWCIINFLLWPVKMSFDISQFFSLKIYSMRIKTLTFILYSYLKTHLNVLFLHFILSWPLQLLWMTWELEKLNAYTLLNVSAFSVSGYGREVLHTKHSWRLFIV